MALLKDDASVQFLVKISSAADPDRFHFDLQTPAGSSIEINAEGAVVVTDKGGDLVGGLAPPWARDAEGRSIDTWFELVDDGVVQVVAHQGQTDVEYPVIADPYLGRNLFSSTSLSGLASCSSQGCLYYRINLNLSDWGVASGTLVMLSNGWTEAKNRQPRVTRYTTSKDQYDCHATYYLGSLVTNGRPERNWNLEENRKATRNSYTWLRHSCNW